MELPNYVLADLPDSSALRPKLITDACQTLKLNRKKFLTSQTTDYLISIFSKLAREWLDPEFPFRKLVAYISTVTTLVPGDIIVTGTPTGAGARLDPPVWLKPGDVVEVEAEGIGLLRNGVVDERAAS